MGSIQYNQTVLNQMIENHRLSHAFIFVGDKGTGKKETAEWFARRFYCEHVIDGNPCNQCDHCRRILNHDFPDYHYIQPEGKQIKVEQIAQLKRELSRSGLETKTQFFVIDQADTMTEASANQLLKFIEDPVTPFIAVLITTHTQKLLDTIVSRCQIVSFSRPLQQTLEEQLKARIEDDALAYTLSYLTAHQEEALALYEDPAFIELYQHVQEWYRYLVTRDPMSFVYVATTLLNDVKARAKTNEALLVQQQLLSLLMIQAKRDYMEQQKDVYRQLLDDIERAKLKLKSHVNFQHILEQLAYHMMKG